MWQPILRGTKITIFLLTVALTSSFITIQSSRPTQAESLLYTVGCIVRGLLTTNCPSTTQPAPPAEQPNTTPPPQTTNNAETPPPQTTNTNNPPATTEPMEIDKQLLTQLPPVPEVKDAPIGSTANGMVLPNTRGVNASSIGVLGTSDSAAIRATSQGWNIVGAPWYWWLIAIGGVVGLYFGLKSFINKSFLGIVK